MGLPEFSFALRNTGQPGDTGRSAAAAPDWNQNDPDGPGYIKNRPFYADTPKWVEWLPETSILGADHVEAPGIFAPGKSYRVSMHLLRDGSETSEALGSPVELVAYVESNDEITVYVLGDSIVQRGNGDFVPTYGFSIATVVAGGAYQIAIGVQDQALTMSTFGVSAETMAGIGAGDVLLTSIEKLEDGIHKIDPKFLPDSASVSGSVHICDIGSADFDPTTLDFSQYAAGDVVLVVQNMGAES